MNQRLDELLQRCTVKLSVPGKLGHGTGFFVAPGLILTCAHVVKAAGFEPVKVCWQNQDGFADAVIERFLPDLFDLALLRLSSTVPDLPCVYLDALVQPDDKLYSYGYPDDFPMGGPVTFECEGFTGDDPPLIKFKAGQTRPGLSGSPLLNLRTGKVCGIVKFTRDRSSDLGGGAIPTTVILSQWPELEGQNREFHQQDAHWTKLLARPSPVTHLTRQEYRNRRDLLNEVKQEVLGRLRQSLRNAVLINLQKENQPQQVRQPWGVEVKISQQTSYQLSPGTEIIEVFDREKIAGRLLILGAPGSGKTTSQLELARTLITRAENDDNEPIPVLFNLSSWKDDKQIIADWLVAELKSKYGVRIDIGKKLIENRQLLPLLDGLDELASERQERCVRTINRLLEGEQRPQYLVVCSRLEEYESHDTELQLNGAIYLQPLTKAQIQQYLVDVQRRELWQGTQELWQSIQDDPSLLELARSPLLLSMMILAYKEISIQEWQGFSSASERLKYLFGSYIRQMLVRKIKPLSYARSKAPKPEETKRWLIWLAKQLKAESQTEFLIEKMQPTWLQTRFQKLMYRIGVILIFGLGAGLSFGLIGGLIIVLISGLDTGTGMSFGLVSGLILGLISGLGGGLSEEIKPVESLKWSWVKARRGVILGLISGLIGGLIIVLISGLDAGAMLIAGLISGLILGLIGGLISPDIEKESRTVPNLGIRRSVANAGIGGLGFGLIAGILGLGAGLIGGVIAAICGLIFGLSVGLSGGTSDSAGRACIQHFMLRVVLWRNNYIPWNYARFLNYSTERMFLQRVGGRYRFVHALLRDHFAQMPLEYDRR